VKMSDVLRPHQNDIARFVAEDPRGKHLLPFLLGLSETLVAEKQALLQELKSVSEGIEHMADLVRSQQSFAISKGVFEKAVLQKEVEHTLKMLQKASAIDDVEIVREYEQLPAVMVDRNKLLEILVNLVQNARQAVESAEVYPKLITLRVYQASEETVRIEVEDNGVGIASDELTRVFNHGYTTKESGHGFGLHMSANAAREMDGSLSAHSDGPGMGATFVLELPLEREKELAPAA